MTLNPTMDEKSRLAELHHLQILDTLPQQIFDDITHLAAGICNTPIALLCMVDAERQWFKSRIGVDISETPRSESFCTHAIAHPDEVMVISNALEDDRFKDLRLVKEDGLLFYAGAPIVTSSGAAVGTVCVLDDKPGQLSAEQQRMLQHLANLSVALIEHEQDRSEQARETLRQVERSQQVIRNVLNEGRDMAAFIDPQHRYSYVNPAFQRYWLMPPSDIIGLRVADLVQRDAYRELYRPSLQRALSGIESQFEVESDFPGLGRRYLEITHIPARESGGQATGVVERARDITQRKQGERALDRAIAELETKRLANRKYVYSISHDLKEPVNAIFNAASVLKEEADARDATMEQQCARIALDSSVKLSRILDDLRMYSELDSGDLRTRPCPAQSVYNEAIATLKDQVDAMHTPIDLSVKGTVRVDAPLFSLAIRSVLEHLLRSNNHPNLGKITRIHIQSHQEVQWHCVRIALEFGATVMNIPNQVLMSGKPASQGGTTVGDVREVGLGLSIASHIIALHQGVLRIESSGSTIQRCSILLPHIPDESLF